MVEEGKRGLLGPRLRFSFSRPDECTLSSLPCCVVSQGELVLLIQPDGPFPLADWSTPWEEMVLVRGPDVMFDVVDLDPTDDIIEVRTPSRLPLNTYQHISPLALRRSSISPSLTPVSWTPKTNQPGVRGRVLHAAPDPAPHPQGRLAHPAAATRAELRDHRRHARTGLQRGSRRPQGAGQAQPCAGVEPRVPV